jgi:hypothetical protein
MSKYVLLVACLLLANLATAVSFSPYFESTLDRAWCIADYYEYLAGQADDFGAPDMEGLYVSLWDSFGDLIGYAEVDDVAGFNAEYANFISIANEIRWSYFYYGIMDGYPFSDLWQNYVETQQGVLWCYAGGPE